MNMSDERPGPWDELQDDGSTEGDTPEESHLIPTGLLEIHLACEEAGITPATFAKLVNP